MTAKARNKGKVSRLTTELLETAHDMRGSGLMTEAAHEKITMRHLGASKAPKRVTARISGSDIRAMRERAKVSQAVFARFLNVTPGYVSQLERGNKVPKGPALVLLNVIRRKGLDVIL
jgi:putative transcriptional regulator